MYGALSFTYVHTIGVEGFSALEMHLVAVVVVVVVVVVVR